MKTAKNLNNIKNRLKIFSSGGFKVNISCFIAGCPAQDLKHFLQSIVNGDEKFLSADLLLVFKG